MPATIEARNAAHVESSSPAQWQPNACAPVCPARLNVTGAFPAEVSRSW